MQSTEKAVSKTGSKSGGQSSGKYTEEYKELEAFVKQQESNLQKLKEKQQEYNDLKTPQNMQCPHEVITHEHKAVRERLPQAER